MSYPAIQVPVIESEKGWGNKIDDYMICLTTEDATVFKDAFNAKNDPSKPTPDWYMMAMSEFSIMYLNDEQLKTINDRKSKRIWKKDLLSL